MGWSATEDANAATIAASFQDVTVSGPTSYYPVIATSHVIHFDANRMLGMAEDSEKGVKKLTVDYTPPQVVNAGSVTVEPSSENNPKVEGGAFTFAGWYSDPECTTPFTWGETLDSDITLYAKWTPGTTTYRINVWKEKVGVLLGSEAHTSATVNVDDFDFHKSIVVTDVPVLSGSAESGWSYSYVTVPDDKQSGVTTGVDEGFVYRTMDDQALLRADGTTEVNVFWNRKVAKTEFYVPAGGVKQLYRHYVNDEGKNVYRSYTYYERYEANPAFTITGLYEQPFSLYVNEDGSPMCTWPEGSWLSELVTYIKDSPNKQDEKPTYDDWVRPTGYIVRSRTHFMQPGVLAERYYLDPGDVPATTMHHILQGANGSWDVADGATKVDISSSPTVEYNVVNPYPYFRATSYSYATYCIDENDANRHAIPSNRKLEPDGSDRYVYYTRSKFKVTFFRDASKAQVAFGPDQQFYQAPLGGYANDRYALPDPASGEYTFGGGTGSPARPTPRRPSTGTGRLCPPTTWRSIPFGCPMP